MNINQYLYRKTTDPYFFSNVLRAYKRYKNIMKASNGNINITENNPYIVPFSHTLIRYGLENIIPYNIYSSCRQLTNPDMLITTYYTSISPATKYNIISSGNSHIIKKDIYKYFRD